MMQCAFNFNHPAQILLYILCTTDIMNTQLDLQPITNIVKTAVLTLIE